MAEHLTDEEQSERVKKWWADNYKSLLLSIVIVGAGYYAYNSYTSHHQKQAEASSQLFQQMVTQSQAKQWDKVALTAENLLKQSTVAAYQDAARLSLAKIAVVKKDYPKAIEQLQSLIKQSKEAALVNVATIRLAKIYLQTQDYTKGLDLLKAPKVSEFAPQMLELRGDLLLQKGDKADALKAYQEAQSKATTLNTPLQGIERKIDYLSSTE